MFAIRTLLIIVALAVACTPRRPPDGSFASRDILQGVQLEDARATNAYEVVERLRPRWMRPRGTTQLPPQDGGLQFRENQVQVYLDDQRLGGIETLRGVEIAAVKYIQHYSEAQASARWGFNHAGGAIYVSTRPLER
jgi:hypothetical protein